jgi:hypothetical protein
MMAAQPWLFGAARAARVDEGAGGCGDVNEAGCGGG